MSLHLTAEFDRRDDDDRLLSVSDEASRCSATQACTFSKRRSFSKQLCIYRMQICRYCQLWRLYRGGEGLGKPPFCLPPPSHHACLLQANGLITVTIRYSLLKTNSSVCHCLFVGWLFDWVRVRFVQKQDWKIIMIF